MAFKLETFDIKDTSIKRITYQNNHLKVGLLNIGGSIERFETPNRHGVFENIVITYSSLGDYIDNTKFLGANVGPYAGRIDPPVLTLNQKTYTLEKNFMNSLNLHSGKDNIAFRLFDVTIIDESRVEFTLRLEDDTLDFPNPMTIGIRYTFFEDGFTITYETTSEVESLSNLTNHSYFNLSGNLKTSVLNHSLKIPADYYMALNDRFIGTKKTSVANTPFDFRESKVLKEGIQSLVNTPQKGLDHPFFLKENPVELRDVSSGRFLSLTTDYDCLVVYTNNILTDHLFEGDKKDKDHLAVCLEAQHLPNDIHSMKDPRSLLKKGQTKTNTITYRVGLCT